jgi:hypothetical protein
MEEALKELIANESDKSFRDKLLAEEEADHKAFMDSPLPSLAATLALPDDIDRDFFFKGDNFCHTARLPSEIRHLGILTESNQTGEDTFDMGIEYKAAALSIPEDGVMQLSFNGKDRQICEIPPNKDYKDFFYVHDAHGWTHLTLPNDAEVKAYGTDKQLRGWIAICWKGCDWGKCEKGTIRQEEFLEGKGEMMVNGVPVTNLTKFDGCGLLKHEGGHAWKPNSDGRFEIKAIVHGDGSFMQFSSFVLW